MGTQEDPGPGYGIAVGSLCTGMGVPGGSRIWELEFGGVLFLGMEIRGVPVPDRGVQEGRSTQEWWFSESPGWAGDAGGSQIQEWRFRGSRFWITGCRGVPVARKGSSWRFPCPGMGVQGVLVLGSHSPLITPPGVPQEPRDCQEHPQNQRCSTAALPSPTGAESGQKINFLTQFVPLESRSSLSAVDTQRISPCSVCEVTL